MTRATDSLCPTLTFDLKISGLLKKEGWSFPVLVQC